MEDDAESVVAVSSAYPWHAGGLPSFAAINSSATTAESTQSHRGLTDSDRYPQQQQQAPLTLQYPPEIKRRLQPDRCKEVLDGALNAHRQRRLQIVDDAGGANLGRMSRRRKTSQYAGIVPSSRVSKRPLALADSQLYRKRSLKKAEAAVAATEVNSASNVSPPAAQLNGSPRALRGHAPTPPNSKAQRRQSSLRISSSLTPSAHSPRHASPSLSSPRISESGERTLRDVEGHPHKDGQKAPSAASRGSSAVDLHTRDVLPPIPQQKTPQEQNLLPQKQQQQQEQKDILCGLLAHSEPLCSTSLSDVVSPLHITPSAASVQPALASQNAKGGGHPLMTSPCHPQRQQWLPSFRRINSAESLNITDEDGRPASLGKKKRSESRVSICAAAAREEPDAAGHRPMRPASSSKTLSIVWVKRPRDASSASHRVLQRMGQHQRKLENDRRDKRTQWKLRPPSSLLRQARKKRASGQQQHQQYQPQYQQRRRRSRQRRDSETLREYDSSNATEVFEESDGSAYEDVPYLQHEQLLAAMRAEANRPRRTVEAVLARHDVAVGKSTQHTPQLPHATAGASKNPSRPPPPPAWSSTDSIGADTPPRGHRVSLGVQTAARTHHDRSGDVKGGPTARSSPSSPSSPHRRLLPPPSPPDDKSTARRQTHPAPSKSSASHVAGNTAEVEKLAPVVADHRNDDGKHNRNSGGDGRRTLCAASTQTPGEERDVFGHGAQTKTQAGAVAKKSPIVAGEEEAGKKRKQTRAGPQSAPSVSPPQLQPSLPVTRRAPSKQTNGSAKGAKAPRHAGTTTVALPPLTAGSQPPQPRRPPLPPLPPPTRQQQLRRRSMNRQQLSYVFAPYKAGMPTSPGGRVRYNAAIEVHHHRHSVRPQLGQSNEKKERTSLQLQLHDRAPAEKPIDYTALTNQFDPLNYLLGRHGFWGESTTR
ncbi:hypothetical protein ABB37_05892 [Leptomonas pyrrhocoris]|uniref:Uncharacterized protein n=1 Tax=Leptomonas pyrrhocoris TaxID=157538 RepID=A0A0M9FYW2_LEPPY|nr:hypothetical protein ABB37_05892 [Leptomonas pyrrhocoris]KPA78793.1 hypothetical protein ABB37_05892 [Leptomonas pyrrhocoris]|eukprot:XP_015657232.1 hypothetical protein ABB37_05892 [Leptomonas pyrrhocoris]